MARLTSALSFSTSSGGVPAGAKKPCHDSASNPPSPASFSVGTSGNMGSLAFDVRADLRSRTKIRAEHHLFVADEIASPKGGRRLTAVSGPREISDRVSARVYEAAFSHTAVSWNAEPPFGGTASPPISVLMQAFSSNASAGQMPSTISVSGCCPPSNSASSTTDPRSLPIRTRAACSTP
jgi:hypothetical protein